ncbi:STAS/SEC14 domain-containing protein [Lysobacter sp. 2RAF19]
MPSTIKVIPNTDIIELRYAGEVDHAARMAALDDLEDRYRRGGFKRLLVNYTSAWPADEPPAMAVRFLDKLTALSFPRGARIAFLNQPDALMTASEPVAAGFGYRMRKFRERPDAIAWLLGDTT